MQQIGITNDVDQRIGSHERSGWELVDTRKFDDGELCAANKGAGLTALRLGGAGLEKPNDVVAMRLDGDTEAWPTHTHSKSPTCNNFSNGYVTTSSTYRLRATTVDS
jgi:hypothetical protein